MKVYAFLADGFEEIEAITPIDLLRRAGVDVCTVSVHASKAVSGAHGMTLMADALYEECDFTDADLLFLPGGMPGTTNLEAHAGLCELLRQHNEEGKLIAAICAAPSILGKLGLLEGKKATCYPGFENFLGESDTDASVVISDNITTGEGPGAAYDFALDLIEQLIDAETAERIGQETRYR